MVCSVLETSWGERVAESRCNTIVMVLCFNLASYCQVPESHALMLECIPNRNENSKSRFKKKKSCIMECWSRKVRFPAK